MSDFKVLSERQHLLLRPNMYIGSIASEPHAGIYEFKYQTKTYVPALLKIINEVIDNSIDEYIRTAGQHANQIDISVMQNGLDGWQVRIADNGRGIPIVQHDGVWQAELAWTRARAGSNFTDVNRTTLGMNGIGSFATNVFSTKFVGETFQGNKRVRVDCHSNCEHIVTSFDLIRGTKNGTEVTFYPDLERFDLKSIDQDHIDVIHDRIVNLSICYPEINFTFNGKKVAVKNKSQLAKQFHADALVFESDNFTFVIAPSGSDEEFRLHSYVNGLHIKNGGTHLDYFVNSIISELQPAIKKKWKIEVLPNQIRQHLLVASWVRGFPNAKFDSQTKERITNSLSEVKDFFVFDSAAIAKKIINTPAILDPMIAAILQKKELADRRAAAALAKKAQKKKIANHIQAQDRFWQNRCLYITEGLSAIGSLLAVRDANRDGGYALRGKVMNTHGMKPVDILKNKELSELLAVIGLDLNEPDYDELNYGKIYLMMDADQDGNSIACLLMQFFSHWPKLFQEKRIFRVQSPLYVARKTGKKDLIYYTQADYDREHLIGYDVSYIKGLGSLETSDYKQVVDSPVLTMIEWDNNMSLNMAFGDSADARKSWMLN